MHVARDGIAPGASLRVTRMRHMVGVAAWPRGRTAATTRTRPRELNPCNRKATTENAHVPPGATWAGHFLSPKPGPGDKRARNRTTSNETEPMQHDKLKPILFSVIKHTDKEELRRQIPRDIVSGIVVAIVALPLSIALAIASGVGPEQGLYTAIVAGFLIALLGGSRVQISGPTAAFATIVAGIVATDGIDGLIAATIIAGILLVLMGLLKLGTLIRFVPYTITTGFTAVPPSSKPPTSLPPSAPTSPPSTGRRCWSAPCALPSSSCGRACPAASPARLWPSSSARPWLAPST